MCDEKSRDFRAFFVTPSVKFRQSGGLDFVTFFGQVFESYANSQKPRLVFVKIVNNKIQC